MTPEKVGRSGGASVTRETYGTSGTSSDRDFPEFGIWRDRLRVFQGITPNPEKAFTKEVPEVTKAVATCGLTQDELKAVAGEEWPKIENDNPTLEALAQAIQTRRMREHGEVPPHYTEVTVCAHCGPVPIFPGVGEQVEGCPWCFNRVRGLSVPRPQKCVDTA